MHHADLDRLHDIVASPNDLSASIWELLLVVGVDEIDIVVSSENISFPLYQ